ncbi:MAG: type II toxin-antitoxin system HicB family antitoxin [Gammaproteobacteria bacterium]|nr:type II toxin-antitoxin system HicB family antitoxin [Gammaproteobacteria bacterium]
MKYLVVIEEGREGFGAYVPDFPGCVSAGTTQEEVLQLIQEAIELHIESMVKGGERIPAPSSRAALVEVRAA